MILRSNYYPRSQNCIHRPYDYTTSPKTRPEQKPKTPYRIKKIRRKKHIPYPKKAPEFESRRINSGRAVWRVTGRPFVKIEFRASPFLALFRAYIYNGGFSSFFYHPARICLWMSSGAADAMGRSIINYASVRLCGGGLQTWSVGCGWYPCFRNFRMLFGAFCQCDSRAVTIFVVAELDGRRFADYSLADV